MKKLLSVFLLGTIVLANIFFFVSCASTRGVKNDTANGLPLPETEVLTELPAKLKKSKCKIVASESKLQEERVVWFALYYDGKRVAADVQWESSDTTVVDLKRMFMAPGLHCLGFCRSPRKVTISAMIQSVTVKKTFKVLPVDKAARLQIIFPADADFSLGEVEPFTITYDGDDVTAKTMSYNTRLLTGERGAYIIELEKKVYLFCNLPGTIYVFTTYNDEWVFRTVSISEKVSPMRIEIPKGAVLKSGKSVQLRALYGAQDVTNKSDWKIAYIVDESKKTVAEYTARKGEVVCKNKGVCFAFARYEGYSAFIKMDVTE